MFKFKFLLWAFTQLLKRQIKNNPDCARYVDGKSLVFQIRTASGAGRHYVIRDGDIRSTAGLAANPQFTLSFKDAAKGFAILSAKDSQAAFLRGLGSKDLIISGDFLEVMWFQGLTAFLQPPRRSLPMTAPHSEATMKADLLNLPLHLPNGTVLRNRLADAGIDLIKISGGTYEAPAMSGAMQEPRKASTVAREAYFLEFAKKVRAAVKVPLMVTSGFRTAAGMNAALRPDALDMVGLARLLAVDPDAPAALLQGRDSRQQVHAINTGLKAVDRMGIMEVLWYTRQLKRIAKGSEPRPDEGGLSAFLKSAFSSGWGTFRTRRLRANS